MKPDGAQLAATFVCCGSTGVLDATVLPVTGTYTLLVDPNGAATASMTLSVLTFIDLSGTIAANGPAVTVTTTVPGQNASYTFSGSAGQAVTVRLSSNTMGYTSVSLLKPDGSVVTSGASSGSSFNLSTQTLPVAGTYTVFINPNSTNTGSITVSITSP